MDVDGDGYDENSDCDDTNPDVNPGAQEVCDPDDIDEDCDGTADDLDASVLASSKAMFMLDEDFDGYAPPGAEGIQACDPQPGLTTAYGDCNDADASVHPGAQEVCDEVGVDEDCDGLVDDLDDSVDPSTMSDWYHDQDGDGFGTGPVLATACDGTTIQAPRDGDCDDLSALVNPDATELCDVYDIDEDCNGLADDDDPFVEPSTMTLHYRDEDGDGHGGAFPVQACDVGPGVSATTDDCDDMDPAVSPSATEICDPLDADEDCDGLADDADGSTSTTSMTTWYQDLDGDGYAGSGTTRRCDARPSDSLVSADCDDTDAAVNPAATEVCDAANTDEDCDGLVDDADSSVDTSTYISFYVDLDGDGYAGLFSESQCDTDATHMRTADDCDDTDASIHPAAAEVCDAADVDEDCDGLVDDADPSVSSIGTTAYYTDLDGDGYAGSTQVNRCDRTAADSLTWSDCDDTDDSVNPGATEVCDAANTDEDCDGVSDDDDPSVDVSTYIPYYVDLDGDGYFGSSTESQCDRDADHESSWSDCDDTDAAIKPSAWEVCDAADVDENCNGVADDDDSTTRVGSMTLYYVDGDLDGYAGASEERRCDPTAVHHLSATDCDDADAAVHPGATEVCDADGVDDDCDGFVDGADPGVDTSTYAPLYTDADGDGYGAAAAGSGCQAAGLSWTPGDCDDADSGVNPGAEEVCATTADDDCDGDANEVGVSDCVDLYVDGDADGYGAGVPSCQCTSDGTHEVELDGDCDDADATASPGLPEDTSDGIDNDCDGRVDELGPLYPLSGSYDLQYMPYRNAAHSGVSSSDDFGDHVAVGGDVDQDGYGDLLAVAPGRTTGGSGAGSVFLLRGPMTAPTSATVELYGAAGDGVDAAAIVGDQDGDGVPDVLVAAEDAVGGSLRTGRLYLVSGTDALSGGDLSTVSAASWLTSGTADFAGDVLRAGDVFGDGAEDDFLVSIGSSTTLSYFLVDGPVSVASGDEWDLGATVVSTGTSFGLVSVATGSDLDGDGVHDMLFGGGTGTGSAASNAVYAVLGSASIGAGVSLPTDADTTFRSTHTLSGDPSERTGWSVAFAGDVDGDGYGDVAAGLASTSYGGVAVFYGPMSAGTTVTSMGAWYEYGTGCCASGAAGRRVAAAGDVDEDGHADLWMGVEDAAWLHYGSVSGGTYDMEADAAVTVAADIDMMVTGDLDADGFLDLILGVPDGYPASSGTASGAVEVLHASTSAVSDPDARGVKAAHRGGKFGAGDVDGDGYDDIIAGTGYGSGALGALHHGPHSVGQELLPASADEVWTVSTSIVTNDAAVLAGADYDGDGFDDLLFGAPYWETTGLTQRGAVFMVAGGASVIGGPLSAGVQINGAAARDRFGAGLAHAGDVDDDGIADLLVGSSYAGGSNAGKAWLFYGPLTTGASADATITGGGSNEHLGGVVDGGVDVDGDGVADVLVTAWGESSSTGAAYLFTGMPTGSLTSGDADVSILGTAGHDYAGEAACLPGDVDGDGYGDLLVGASGYGTTGLAALFHGPLSGAMDLDDAGAAIEDWGSGVLAPFGADLACPGDLDGDGYADIAVEGGYEYLTTVHYGPLADGRIQEVFGASSPAPNGTYDIDGDGNPALLLGNTFLEF